MDYRQLYRMSFDERKSLLEKELEIAWGSRNIPRYLELCNELGIEPQLNPELDNIGGSQKPSPESYQIAEKRKAEKYLRFYKEACGLNPRDKNATPERILLEKYFHKFGSFGSQPITQMDDYAVKSRFRGVLRFAEKTLRKLGLIA